MEPARVGHSQRKIAGGIPEGSRATVPGYEWLRKSVTDPVRVAAAGRLAPIAADLGCTVAQLSIAWCSSNPHVSTVITGASRVSQIQENMKALDVIPKITADVRARIDAAFDGVALE